MGQVDQRENATIVKIMAKNEVTAAVLPPPAFDLLTENPEQHAKKEKMVARMMEAWMPIDCEGMTKAPSSLQRLLFIAQVYNGEPVEHVLPLFNWFHQTTPP